MTWSTLFEIPLINSGNWEDTPEIDQCAHLASVTGAKLLMLTCETATSEVAVVSTIPSDDGGEGGFDINTTMKLPLGSPIDEGSWCITAECFDVVEGTPVMTSSPSPEEVAQ